jgi:hypothetical protein
MIKCDLMEITEHELISDGKKKKFGRYHGSMFWSIPGFGSKKWVVAARIKVEDAVSDLTEQEILEGCIAYLNAPPPRKKFQRRIKKPKYGSLELYKGNFIEVAGNRYISALLITDQRNNKHFWGKGIVTTK